MPFVSPPPPKGRLVFPFHPPQDLTDFIVMQDAGWTIETKQPALWMVQDPGGPNSVGEVMLYEYGTRGFPGNALAIGTTGSNALRHKYRFRTYWSHYDNVDGPNTTMRLGIRHGSYPAGTQPYPATLANTLAEIRVRLNDSLPYGVELAYCPGGGAGLTLLTLSTTIAPPPEASAYLELVVDYPNQLIEGWVNGVKGGSLPMTGWNGSRLPSTNVLGKTPWMSLYCASGNDAAAQIWYSAFSGSEMEIVSGPRLPY